MQATTTPADWESSLAEMLADLSNIQEELLQVLADKRDTMASADAQSAAPDRQQTLQQREADVCRKLEDFRDRRTAMLAEAKRNGLPAKNLKALADAANGGKTGELGKQAESASHKMRLIQQHCLTNWVVAQRSLLHVSQLLEIIATGGRLKPTYGKGDSIASSGALVDREA